MREFVSIILAIVIGFAIISIIGVIPVFLLWNWLMPTLFGLPIITFWQALGLSLLSGFLFKNSTVTNKK